MNNGASSTSSGNRKWEPIFPPQAYDYFQVGTAGEIVLLMAQKTKITSSLDYDSAAQWVLEDDDGWPEKVGELLELKRVRQGEPPAFSMQPLQPDVRSDVANIQPLITIYTFAPTNTILLHVESISFCLNV